MKLPEGFALRFGPFDLKGERFRPAHVHDVLAMERICFASPWSIGLLRQEARPQDHAWNLVVRVDGELHAYFFNWIVLDEMHLLNFAVHPSRQGRGLGGCLLDWMLARAAEGGYREVSLEVRASNEPAIRLYASRGFKILYRRKGYYSDNGEDALVMLCVLESARAGDPASGEGQP